MKLLLKTSHHRAVGAFKVVVSGIAVIAALAIVTINGSTAHAIGKQGSRSIEAAILRGGLQPGQIVHTNGAGTPTPAPTPTLPPPGVVVSGPTQYGTYPNYSYAILVGQQCSASVGNLPAADPNTTPVYTWGVSGTTFQYWSNTTAGPPANSQASSYLGGFLNPETAPQNYPTTSWYWNDPMQTSETITCSVTETVSGVSKTFTATPVTVLVCVPMFTASGVPGYVQVNNLEVNSSSYMLWAGPTSHTNPGTQNGVQIQFNSDGMTYYATVTTPNTPVNFGYGKLEFVQLVSPNSSYTIGNPSVTVYDPINGQTGLDTAYPLYNYVYDENPSAGAWNGDSPGMPLNSNMNSAQINHSFTTFVMYLPPHGGMWVPLGYLNWSASGSAAKSGADWSSYAYSGTGKPSDWAGPVTPSTTTAFIQDNAFPTWQAIVQSDNY